MPFALPGQSILTVGGRRVVVGDPISAAKTYADFVAHITALAVNGTRSWSDNIQNGKWVTTAASQTGSMIGSPWQGYFIPANTVVARAILHSMPDESTMNAQASPNRQIYFETATDSVTEVFALDRNGYESGAAAGSFGASTFVLVIWWDDTLKKAFSNNPSIGSAPVEYPF